MPAKVMVLSAFGLRGLVTTLEHVSIKTFIIPSLSLSLSITLSPLPGSWCGM